MSSQPAQGAAVGIRPFTAEDAAFFSELAGDDRVTKFVGDGRPWTADMVNTRTRAALAHIPTTEIGAVRWFIAQLGLEPVGVLVSARREAGVEIGFWVSPRFWGRGIAGRMVDHALRVIPDTFGAVSLVARVDPANAASARVLTRRGFTRVAVDGGLEQYVNAVPAGVTPTRRWPAG